MRADGLDEHRLARGAHPPGRRAASGSRSTAAASRSRSRWTAATARRRARHAAGLRPRRPDRLRPRRRRSSSGRGASPRRPADVRADGQQLAWVQRRRHLSSPGASVARGTQPDWRPAGRRQGAPARPRPARAGRPRDPGRPGTGCSASPRSSTTSALGPLMIVGSRRPSEPRDARRPARAARERRWRTYAASGRLALHELAAAPPLAPDATTTPTSCARSTGDVLVRDRKSGFCLADHYGIAPGDFGRRRTSSSAAASSTIPRRAGSSREPRSASRIATRRSSTARTTTSPASPPAIYDLVHRANPATTAPGARYENDAASVRIRLAWREGKPHVKTLRRCQATADC